MTAPEEDDNKGIMAAVLEPVLLTVGQYRRLPVREDVVHELHWGQVITLTRPRMRHAKLQSRLVRLLRPKAEHLGVVESEVAFRALPEYDLRGADVAFVSRERWETASDDDNLHGAPELVIEVLSPSNTKSEIQEKAALCLATGSREFWVVDVKRKCVTITGTDGQAVVYQMGERMPLPLFDSDLDVDSIFA